jgi:hypothetical protein
MLEPKAKATALAAALAKAKARATDKATDDPSRTQSKEKAALFKMFQGNKAESSAAAGAASASSAAPVTQSIQPATRLLPSAVGEKFTDRIEQLEQIEDDHKSPEDLMRDIQAYFDLVKGSHVSEKEQAELSRIIDQASKFESLHAKIRKSAPDSASDKVKRMEKYLADDVSSKGATGNDFYAACKLDPNGLGAQYKAAQAQKSWQATKEIRRKWAMDEKAKAEKSRNHVDSYNKIDTTKTRYLTMGGLVQDMGGWECEEAVLGAKNVIASCTVLGGDWIWNDPMSKIRHYARITKESAESLEEKWSIFTKQVIEATNRGKRGNKQQMPSKKIIKTKRRKTNKHAPLPPPPPPPPHPPN